MTGELSDNLEKHQVNIPKKVCPNISNKCFETDFIYNIDQYKFTVNSTIQTELKNKFHSKSRLFLS
jgi:hypothetical protein